MSHQTLRRELPPLLHKQAAETNVEQVCTGVATYLEELALLMYVAPPAPSSKSLKPHTIQTIARQPIAFGVRNFIYDQEQEQNHTMTSPLKF